MLVAVQLGPLGFMQSEADALRIVGDPFQMQSHRLNKDVVELQ